QYPSKSLAELGIQGSARYFDVEGTLAYLVVDNDIVVVDFSDPANPRQVMRLTGVGTSLRALAVKDGFIYSLSTGTGAQDGLNVSIALPTSQIFVSGASGDPATACANPVVLDRATRTMKQGASIYFQVFGHNAPAAQEVVIRKGEQVLATVPATVLPSSTGRVTLGHALWNSHEPIDRAAEYTAEVVLDRDGASEFRSLREPIPFSFLIENYSDQMSLVVKGDVALADEKALYGYVLGAPSNVTLTVNGNPVVNEPRGFGLNVEQPALAGLAPGRYPFTLRAEMAGAAGVSDQVGGVLTVRRGGDDERTPGHPVVGGVDLATGSLGLTQPDVPEIKNRGLSLSLVRSYNSAQADNFGSLGYGWQHNFNVLLTSSREPGGGVVYRVSGGDGSGQTFKAASATGALQMRAEKPYHGSLVRNGDGSFDFYTTGRVRHHFPGAYEHNHFNFYNQSYMGNLEYIQEPNGNRLALEYDTAGRMRSVTDSSGRALEFTYEAAPSPFAGVVAPVNASRTAQSCVPRGQFSLLRTRFVKSQVGQAWRVKEVKGPGGLVVAYDYDADGNLVKVTRKGTDGLSAPAADAVWRYAYKPSAPEGTAGDLTHLLKSATNPNDHTTGYDYWFEHPGFPVKTVSMPEAVTNGYA
ncbi:MAG TPA: DUF6531 domain-containing protein, partial [Pyrinomonadaceae bacterium]|nr:DUF6531 domain-containing protein [Pyrinomonadaceae bacterium]